jgi:hypothetical protein
MNNKPARATTPTADQPTETGPWGAALAQLQKWDPKWAATCLKMTTDPWTSLRCGRLACTLPARADSDSKAVIEGNFADTTLLIPAMPVRC